MERRGISKSKGEILFILNGLSSNCVYSMMLVMCFKHAYSLLDIYAFFYAEKLKQVSQIHLKKLIIQLLSMRAKVRITMEHIYVSIIGVKRSRKFNTTLVSIPIKNQHGYHDKSLCT